MKPKRKRKLRARAYIREVNLLFRESRQKFDLSLEEFRGGCDTIYEKRGCLRKMGSDGLGMRG